MGRHPMGFKALTGLSVATLIGSMLLGYSNCSNFEVLNLNSGLEARQGPPSDFTSDVQISSYSQEIVNASNTNSACVVSGDLDISTHYKAGIGPSPGGKDHPNIFNPELWNEIRNKSRHVYMYVNHFIPGHDNYLSSEYDHDKPSRESFEADRKSVV